MGGIFGSLLRDIGSSGSSYPQWLKDLRNEFYEINFLDRISCRRKQKA